MEAEELLGAKMGRVWIHQAENRKHLRNLREACIWIRKLIDSRQIHL